MRMNKGIFVLSVMSALALSACSSTSWDDPELNPDMVDEKISVPAQQVMNDALSYKSLSTSNVEIYDLESGSPYVPDIYSAQKPEAEDAHMVKESFDSGSVTVYPLDVDAFHYGGGEPLLVSDMIELQQQQKQDAEQMPPPLMPMSEASEPFASPFGTNGVVKPGMPQSLLQNR